MSQTPLRRGRPAIPREVQRQRLLSAALEAFRKNDFADTRVADIVRAAGMSSRSFYEVFDSKEDVVVELIHFVGRSLVDHLEEVMATTPDIEGKIDLGLKAYLEAFSGNPIDVNRLGDAGNLRVMGARRQYVNEIADLVLRKWREAHQQGQTRVTPDPVVLDVIVTGLEGLATRSVVEGRARELPELHTPLRRFLLRQLR